MFKNKTILVTGGTGSFGKAFIAKILNNYPDVKKIIVYSRDELKQFEMSQNFPQTINGKMRYFLGDVRDAERLKTACEGVDYIVHAAALKQVPAAEYNPSEFIKTNILGAENVINAAINNKVSKVVALSTDKAAAPINLYGATKLCSDKLFVAANNIVGAKNIKFSVVRYGNVMGSRGSVIPFFTSRKGVLPVTDVNMTRFNITLDEGVDMVIDSFKICEGGEILVPKIPSYRILDVVAAVSDKDNYEVVGIRPGEKIHEEMITTSDAPLTVDIGKYYAILPISNKYTVDEYCNNKNGKKVPDGFYYNSGENDQWLTSEQLKSLIENKM